MGQIFALFDYLVDKGFIPYENVDGSIIELNLKLLKKSPAKVEFNLLFLSWNEDKTQFLKSISFVYLPGEYIEQVMPKMTINFKNISTRRLLKKQGYCMQYLGSLLCLDDIFEKYSVEDHFLAITENKQLTL